MSYTTLTYIDLDLPELMERLGDGDYARPRTFCPFCKDASKCFSVTKARTSAHRWRCRKCLKEGGCLEYLMTRNGLCEHEASRAYAEISSAAGGLWVAREHRDGYRAGPSPAQIERSQSDSSR